MIDFKKHVEILRNNSINIHRGGIDFKYSFGTINECRELIKRGFEYFEPEIKFKWLPEYERIAEYLSDTGNKGLSLIGNSGRGKTLFLTKIMPVLMASKKKKAVFYNRTNYKNGASSLTPVVVDANWVLKVFNAKDTWGKYSLRIIDEVGRERNPIKGEIEPFPAYVDWCEVNNLPLFFCSNMPGQMFEERYGKWTVDRIVKLSHRVIFEGESLRK